MPSERVDNAGILQCAEIDVRDENQWLHVWIGDCVLELTVHLNADFFSTVRALRLNGKG